MTHHEALEANRLGLPQTPCLGLLVEHLRFPDALYRAGKLVPGDFVVFRCERCDARISTWEGTVLLNCYRLEEVPTARLVAGLAKGLDARPLLKGENE